jgi:hypothetical protein
LIPSSNTSDEEQKETKKKSPQKHKKLPITKKPPRVVETDYSSDDFSLSEFQDPHPDAINGISLSLDTDDDFLSPLHAYMRKFCVEAFAVAQPERSHLKTGRSHGVNRIVPGQVGIRCIHCKHRPDWGRPERAVCFPSSLRNIYHSIETWQRRHSLVCQDIPDWVKKNLTDLMQCSKSGAGGRRQYWEESARRLGLIDTPHGIFFSRKPGLMEEPQQPDPSLESRRTYIPVVVPAERDLVTDYLFLLLDQMEVCQFTEGDRTGGRSKIKNCPVGYPGLQCTHCVGKAGFGRYFPVSCAALTSANSDRNIFNHVVKCRRCPQHIKENLQRLHKEQVYKNRRGSRKLFFQRVWDRLHPRNGEQAISFALEQHEQK